MVDKGKKRAIQVEKEGFPEAVMQNFWITEAAGMAAFGHEECKMALFLRMYIIDVYAGG